MNFGIHAYSARSVHRSKLGLWWYDVRNWLYCRKNCPDRCCHVLCDPDYKGN